MESACNGNLRQRGTVENLNYRESRLIRENRKISSRNRSVSLSDQKNTKVGKKKPDNKPINLAPSNRKDSTIIRPAETLQDHIRAFQLIKKQYNAFGYSPGQKCSIYITPWNLLYYSQTFIALHGDEVIGTITSIQDEAGHLPIDASFEKEMKTYRAQNRTFVEMSSFVTAGDYSDSRLPLGLLRTAITYCRLNKIQDWVFTVHPRHVPFYLKILLGEKMTSTLRHCEMVSSAPGALLRLDLTTLENRMRIKYGNKKGMRNLHHFFYGVDEETTRISQIKKSLLEKRKNWQTIQSALKETLMQQEIS